MSRDPYVTPVRKSQVTRVSVKLFFYSLTRAWNQNMNFQPKEGLYRETVAVGGLGKLYIGK